MFTSVCRRSWRVPPWLIVLSGLATFSALARRATAEPSPPLASTPSPASTAAPPQVSPPIGSGAALYARYCQLCHAADATGYAADNAPSLVSPTFLATASDEFIASGIRLGRPETAMAAYGKLRGGPLDDAQIAAIVEFLRTKGPAATALPELKVSGDTARGASLYARHCQSCHGGGKTPAKAPQLSNREFLAAASPAFVRHAIVHGRPPTRMPAFEKRLSQSQVDDLVAWFASLRTKGAQRSPSATPPSAAPSASAPVVIHPKGKAPDFSLREGRFVSAEQVKRALDARRRIIIVDARAASDWIQFHIPGAISIPYYETALLDRIPNDGTWVVAYCGCPHHASGEVVDALRRRNYPHTAVLDEGILFWRRQGYALAGEAAEPEGKAPERPQP
ncbi:MAG TPA: c-type cytochrome [Polyangiaceae bacterium]|nr:c-type cytochrome [Polyangiaceae bacterium]